MRLMRGIMNTKSRDTAYDSRDVNIANQPIIVFRHLYEEDVDIHS
jgi:hypothetical protein